MKKNLVLFLLLPICITNIYGQIHDIEYNSGNNFEIAHFRFWIPETEDGFNALLVVVPGYNGDGRQEANNPIWQAFASKHNLALVACYFKDYKGADALAIFFIGENDLYYRNDLIKGIYSVNRKHGALWTLISEKKTKHEFEASRAMALEYFDRIIPLRLASSGQLLDLTETEHYLGNWETHQAQAFKGKSDSNSLSVWLPDSTFAKIWENQ